MKLEELTGFLRDMVNAPPQAGQGVHKWMYCVARNLHAHLPAGEIVALLEARVAHCGRHVPRTEILDAVTNSLKHAWRPTGGLSLNRPPPQRRWPAVNTKRRHELFADGGGLADLWEASPWRLDDNEPHTEEIIDLLFPGNPLLCVGRYAKKPDGTSYTDFDTLPRESWRGHLAGVELIVPSPMSALTGLTKDGKESAHTLNNTGPRRFLIVEFDQGTADEHAVILLHLAGFAPLVCAVHSGGKSLHGWFLVASQPEDKVMSFFRYAVSLGADDALWTKSQFTRMPDGTRDNGCRQTVYFMNAKPMEETPCLS